jgi:hypothetical protein
MVNLNSKAEWNPDVFNVASFLGGAAAAYVFALMVWYMWRIMIEPMITQHRLRRQAEHELQLDQMRSEIRLAVLAELGGEEDEDQEQGPQAGAP